MSDHRQIIAIVKPYVAEKVLATVATLPIIGSCVVREVKGYCRQKNYLSEYRGSEYSLAFLPKVQISFFVEAAHTTLATDSVAEAARSGRMGDGKIFILAGDGFPL